MMLINSSAIPIDDFEICSMAVSCPSRLAPSDACCTVLGRWPIEVNIWPRVSTSFTGRLVIRAASAAGAVCGHTRNPAPNAPRKRAHDGALRQFDLEEVVLTRDGSVQ